MLVFFLLPLYTTILSTEEFGTVDLVTTYTSLIVIILTLQLEQAVFRYLIESRGNVDLQRNYIKTSLISVSLVNVIFIITVFSILYYIKYEYTFYFIMISTTSSFMSVMLQIARGVGKNSIYATGSCINGSLQIMLNVVFIAFFGMGVNGLLLANLLAIIVTIIFLFCNLRDLFKFDDFRIDKKILKELLIYSLPLIPYTLCWWIINASDRMIINTFLGVGMAGIYAVSYKFPSMFSMITNIFQLSWNESAAENISEDDVEVYYNKTINKAIKFYSICNLIIIVFLPFIFDLLIKEGFKDAFYYIPILMTAALFHSVSSLYSAIYFALKKTKKIIFSTCIAAIINIILDLLLINIIGLYAAAIASLISYIVITIMRHFEIQRFIKIKIDFNYLVKEIILYVLVFLFYYQKIYSCLIIVMVILIIRFLKDNKELIENIIKLLVEKVGKKNDA